MSKQQNGFVYRKGPSWFLMYYDNFPQPDGTIKRKQVCKKLADYGGQYRSKASLQLLVEDVLNPLRSGTLCPNSNMAVADFVEDVYFPYIKNHVRPYTEQCYRQFFTRHLRARLGKLSLREFRTMHAQSILSDIARPQTLSKSTLQHLKAFLSGVFTTARNLGYLDTGNPIPGVKLPREAKPTPETHAYTLAEVDKILSHLSGQTQLAVLCAALTGLRRSELRGLRWGDYNGKELSVNRSVVGSDTADTKNASSRAPVPVIRQLQEALDAHKLSMGVLAAPELPIFQAGNKRPLNLDNLAKRDIFDALKGKDVTWHGWHGFRRGLATNLHALGIDDKTIQTILRHSNIQMTQNVYIKSVSDSQVNAMQTLSLELDKRKTSGENAASEQR